MAVKAFNTNMNQEVCEGTFYHQQLQELSNKKMETISTTEAAVDGKLHDQPIAWLPPYSSFDFLDCINHG